MDDLKEYMPSLLIGDELRKVLLELPRYDEGVRKQSASERILELSDLYKIFIPNRMAIEIYTKLYMAMRLSLEKKNSREAILQSKETFVNAKNGALRGIIGGADSFTIIGKSGIGKTSAIERAVSLITQGKEIELVESYQRIIPILQIQCPFDSSVKGLLLEVVRCVDAKLGTNYYKAGSRSNVTTDSLIGLVSQVCLNHIGVLVIDEIQNVTANKKGDSLIRMLMQLINSSGTSICMVGTPECEGFFSGGSMQFARRSLGLHYSNLKNDAEFAEICKLLWNYQYTRKTTQLTDTITNSLYEMSQGNISILIKLIYDAQEMAIISGGERLDVNALQNAYRERLSMLHNQIEEEKEKVSFTKKVRSTRHYHNAKKYDIGKIKTITEIATYSKKNNLDFIAELSKEITIEVVNI